MRRKFLDATLFYPQAVELLDLVGQLYTCEARGRAGGDLATVRATGAAPLVAASPRGCGFLIMDDLGMRKLPATAAEDLIEPSNS